MKKTLSTCAVLCLVLVIAAPAMALDTKFSGSYRARGFSDNKPTLHDDDSTNSYMDMRLRVQTDFLISDNLSLTTRFDALDNKRWGASDSEGTGNNIDWDRAYMTIKGDFGLLNVGRRVGDVWGTLFNDDETERDRIQYIKGIGDLTLIAIFQKSSEGDEGNIRSDGDTDIYYLAGYYKMENITFGLLWGYVLDKLDRGNSDSAKYHALNPYAIGQFGPFGFQGELRYNGFGDREYNDGTPDRDIKQITWNLEGNYSMDMFKFELGYAYAKGQEGEGRDIVGYGGAIGNDWDKLWILTASEDDFLTTNLGGQGNLSTDGSNAGGPLAAYGAQIYYGGVTVMPMEGLDIGFIVAYAEAEDTPSGIDDEYGWEYNLKLNYQIFDNLTYSFIAAYLDAGDYWVDSSARRSGVTPATLASNDLEDNISLFHSLTLKF